MASVLNPDPVLELVPEGVHTATLTSLEDYMSKTGKPMYIVAWEFPEHQTTLGANMTILTYLMAYPYAFKRFFDPSDQHPEYGEGFDPNDLVGKAFTVSVQHEPYNGRMRANVVSAQECDFGDPFTGE